MRKECSPFHSLLHCVPKSSKSRKRAPVIIRKKHVMHERLSLGCPPPDPILDPSPKRDSKNNALELLLSLFSIVRLHMCKPWYQQRI